VRCGLGAQSQGVTDAKARKTYATGS